VLARLGCLFIVVPLVELALLIQMSRWVGLGPTVLLVAVTGFAGALLARTQGLRTLASVQLELARGRLPTRSLMDGASILVGGAFLMTPGILTDAAGFALLLTPTRRLIQGWVLARLGRAIKRGTLRVTHFGMERFSKGSRPGGSVHGDPDRTGGRPGHPGDPRPGRREQGWDEEADDDDDTDDGPRPPPRPGEIIQE